MSFGNVHVQGWTFAKSEFYFKLVYKINGVANNVSD